MLRVISFVLKAMIFHIFLHVQFIIMKNEKDRKHYEILLESLTLLSSRKFMIKAAESCDNKQRRQSCYVTSKT